MRSFVEELCPLLVHNFSPERKATVSGPLARDDHSLHRLVVCLVFIFIFIFPRIRILQIARQLQQPATNAINAQPTRPDLDKGESQQLNSGSGSGPSAHQREVSLIQSYLQTACRVTFWNTEYLE